MRHKPAYNNLRLIYKDLDGVEWQFYCNEVTSQAAVQLLIGQPVKDVGSRYITDSDLDFAIDGEIIQGTEIKRIIEMPEIRPIKDNNSRRGVYRKVKVIVTS